MTHSEKSKDSRKEVWCKHVLSSRDTVSTVRCRLKEAMM